MMRRAVSGGAGRRLHGRDRGRAQAADRAGKNDTGRGTVPIGARAADGPVGLSDGAPAGPGCRAGAVTAA